MAWIPQFLFEAGGLVYHFRAWLYRKILWTEFISRVEGWIISWLNRAAPSPLPTSSSTSSSSDKLPCLIIVGPSAGWTLPLEAFLRFQKIILLDPDRIGLILFRFRMQRLSIKKKLACPMMKMIHPHKQDVQSMIQTWMQVFADNPHAPILFSNLFGQKPCCQIFQDEHVQNLLFQSLRGHAWASYHDLYSFKKVDLIALEARGDSLKQQIEVIDHETDWIRKRAQDFAFPLLHFDQQVEALGEWQLNKNYVHRVGFLASCV